MKSTLLLIAIPLLFIQGTSSSEIPCDVLREYVETEMTLIDEVTPDAGTSFVVWAKQYFSLKGKFVVAKLIVGSQGQTKKYVFCGVSDSDWSDFTWILPPDAGMSFNKKYHKYLKPYKCDCEP